MSGRNETLLQKEGSLAERLARQIGISANARSIYGDPVERDGVTVIPVAKAAYGFGGGGGKKENEEGSGGGGGVMLTPVGYIEIKNGETRFRPTLDPMGLVPAVLAAAPIVLLAVWNISKRLRRKDLK